MTAGSSAYSSQALVPVVTARSSRAPAWVTTIARSDTSAPVGVGRGGCELVDRIQGGTATSSALPVLTACHPVYSCRAHRRVPLRGVRGGAAELASGHAPRQGARTPESSAASSAP